jgi:hypothetical protein
MPKLYYWIAENTYAEQYSLIGKTKKEVLQKLESFNNKDNFERPVKRCVEYKDVFNLFDWVTGEGGGRCSGSLTPTKNA